MPEYKENEDFLNTEEGPEEPPPISPVDEEVVTAVLLIMNKQGAVLPVTNLETLKMERQATAHEVFRMCADVADQISAVRVVGELAQINQHQNTQLVKSFADLLAKKMDTSLGV
jgi:hypothetical protein